MNKAYQLTKKIGAVLLLAYVGFCGLVYFCPQYFFYKPSQEKSNIETARQSGKEVRELSYSSEDGTPLIAWFAPGQKNKPLILFLHGNSHNIENFYPKLVPLNEAGYAVLLAEYRGFGGIKGTITQENLVKDARAALREAYKLGYKNNNIVVYGMSLGSHMAIKTVYDFQKRGIFAGLILEVPFDNIVNVVKKVFPLPVPGELIIKDKYVNEDMIAAIRSPILIMGGSKDTVVPVELAKNLYKQAPEPKRILVYEGAGHSNLFDFQNYNAILAWLKEKVR